MVRLVSFDPFDASLPMTVRRRTRASAPEATQVAARPVLFPDEDPQTYDSFRRSLLSELAPATPYEHVLADNLVTIEWEAARYRRTRDQLVLVKARDITVKLLSSTDEVGALMGASDHHRRLGQALVAGGPDQRAEVETALQAIGRSTTEVMVRAFEEARSHLVYIESWLADVEKRRRRLRQDYDDLRASRAQPVQPAAE